MKVRSFFTILLLFLPVISLADQEEMCMGLVDRVRDQCAKFLAEVKDFTLLQQMTAAGSVTEQGVMQKGLRTRIETKRIVEEEGLGVADDVPTSSDVLEIFDGSQGWRIANQGSVEKLPAGIVDEYSVAHNCWGFSLESAVASEPQRIPDRECCIVSVEEDSIHYELVLCSKRFIILEGARVEPSGRTLRWVHSDFKKVHGEFQFPFKTEIFVDGELTSTTDVLHFNVNTDLSDDLFDIEKIRSERGLRPGSVEHGTTQRDTDGN